MKKYCGIIIALVAISLFSAPMLHAQRFGRVERVDAELTPAHGHLVKLRVASGVERIHSPKGRAKMKLSAFSRCPQYRISSFS